MNTDKIFAEALVNEYSPKDTSKVMALRKLDKRAKLPSDIFAYSYGISSALVSGVGMCLAMGEIGGGSIGAKILGVAIGLIGFAAAGLTYPIYKRIREVGKKKYAFEIMELAKDVAKENND